MVAENSVMIVPILYRAFTGNTDLETSEQDGHYAFVNLASEELLMCDLSWKTTPTYPGHIGVLIISNSCSGKYFLQCLIRLQ